MIKAWLLPIVIGLTVSGCSLPRRGPSISEITDPESGVPIVSISQVIGFADAKSTYGNVTVPDWYFTAPRFSVDALRPGDRLNVIIAESSSNGEFLQTLSVPFTVEGVVIEEDGTIRLPYAGGVFVEGRTPSQVASVITTKIDSVLYRPQVQVTRSGSSGRVVTFMGEDGGRSVELGSDLNSLVDVVLSSDAPVRTDTNYLVELRRFNKTAVVPYELLLADPTYDVPLEPGDVVRLTSVVSRFTILGSVGDEKLVNLPPEGLNLMEALATAGGLAGEVADPRGIFVFRKNSDGNAVIYHMNMSQPSEIFAGKDFRVIDGDTIYVSYAPFTQTQKILRAISGTIGVGGSAAQITQ